jgi:hypothetical protein
MIVAIIVMNATGMNVTGTTVAETTVIRRNVTVTIAMIVTVKKGPPDVTGPALLPVVAKMIVAPGHLPLGGITKIKGLQGTMIDGEAMMTGEVLTLIMTAAGTNAGTNAVATKRKIDTTTGLPDTMGKAGGVEGGCRVVVVRGPSKIKGRNGRLIPPTDEDFLLSSASFASFFRAYLQSNCSHVSPLALALCTRSRRILIVVVACPGWPTSRLKVPSSSPASGPRRSGGANRRIQTRISIRARLEIHILEESPPHPHYIYRGQGAMVHLPIRITEREDVRSNLL